MRGYLTFLVLRLIAQKPMSGEDIRNELERRKGHKPSPGTIYPVLKELRKSKLIEEIVGKGKEKRYTMTKTGMREVEIATRRFLMIFYDMKEDFLKSRRR